MEIGLSPGAMYENTVEFRLLIYIYKWREVPGCVTTYILI